MVTVHGKNKNLRSKRGSYRLFNEPVAVASNTKKARREPKIVWNIVGVMHGKGPGDAHRKIRKARARARSYMKRYPNAKSSPYGARRCYTYRNRTTGQLAVY